MWKTINFHSDRGCEVRDAEQCGRGINVMQVLPKKTIIKEYDMTIKE